MDTTDIAETASVTKYTHGHMEGPHENMMPKALPSVDRQGRS